MKAHKYWSMGALITMIGTFYTGYKGSMGVVRTTYLIDEQGVIIKANDKVKAADDPENMLKELS